MEDGASAGSFVTRWLFRLHRLWGRAGTAWVLAPSSWNYNLAELRIVEFKVQILHIRELFSARGMLWGNTKCLWRWKIWASNIWMELLTFIRRLVSYLHFCLVCFLRVKAETLSWACPPGTTCPLLGWGLADGRNQKGFHSDTWVIHLIGKRKDKFQVGIKSSDYNDVDFTPTIYYIHKNIQ